MIMKMTSHKASINKIMHYCNDKAILNDTYNMNCIYNDTTKNKINEMKELQHDNEYKTRKYYHLILSPEEKNIDKDNLLNYGRELLEEKFKDCQATLSVHNDNGRNHLHIILNAYKLDGYKIDIRQNEYSKIKEFAQVKLATKYNFMTTTTKNEKSNDIKKQIDYHKSSQREIVKNSYLNSYKECSTIEELKEKLKKNYHIEIQEYKTKDNQIKFSFKSDFFKSGISEDKLGANFSREMIMKVYAKKQEKKKENNIIPKEEKQQAPKEDIFAQLLRDADTRKAKEDKEKALKEFEKEKYKIYSDTWDKIEESPLKKNTKEELFDNLNKIYKNKNKEPQLIIKDLKDFAKAIINIIKDFIREQENQNTYSRGYER